MSVGHRRAMGRMMRRGDDDDDDQQPMAASATLQKESTAEECDLTLLRGATHRIVLLIRDELRRFRADALHAATFETMQRMQELEEKVAALTQKNSELEVELERAMDPQNARLRWQEFVETQRRNTVVQLQLEKQQELEADYHRCFRRKLMNDLHTKGRWSRFQHVAQELQDDFGDEVEAIVDEYLPQSAKEKREKHRASSAAIFPSVLGHQEEDDDDTDGNSPISTVGSTTGGDQQPQFAPSLKKENTNNSKRNKKKNKKKNVGGFVAFAMDSEDGGGGSPATKVADQPKDLDHDRSSPLVGAQLLSEEGALNFHDADMDSATGESDDEDEDVDDVDTNVENDGKKGAENEDPKDTVIGKIKNQRASLLLSLDVDDDADAVGGKDGNRGGASNMMKNLRNFSQVRSRMASILSLGDGSLTANRAMRSNSLSKADERLVICKNLITGERRFLTFDVSKSLWAVLLDMLAKNTKTLRVSLDIDDVRSRLTSLYNHAAQLDLTYLHHHVSHMKDPVVHIITTDDTPMTAEERAAAMSANRSPTRSDLYSHDTTTGIVPTRRGCVYFLSTSGNTSGFKNGVDSGQFSVFASSTYKLSNTRAVVSPRTSDYFMTDNEPNEWVQIDFGNCVIAPTAYSFTSRHPILTGQFPRNWRLEGSLDGDKWFVLSRHKNDTSLSRRNPYGFWELEPVKGLPFLKMVRVIHEGLNSVGTNALSLSDFEMFGRVLTIVDNVPPRGPGESCPVARPRVWEAPAAMPEAPKAEKKKKR
eukprot:PhM_4_TR14560/c0_g1_i1/m.45645